MKKLFIMLGLLFATFANSPAQDNSDFGSFVKKEKTLMLKAYKTKDIPGYRKNLNDFLARYNKLTDREKSGYSYYVDEEYYLLADMYAVAGDKKNALDYLEKSKDHDYDDLKQDHDLDHLRKEPRFIELLKEAKKTQSQYLATSRKAPKANYEQLMEKFKNFYNQQQVDSIDNLFFNADQMRSWFNQKEMDHLTKDYGKMISYKYVAMDVGVSDDVALFKMVYEKSVHMMGISIDEHDKMATFRFETSSPYIDKLLVKEE